MTILEVQSGGRSDRCYVLPLSIQSGPRAAQLLAEGSALVIQRLGGDALLCDALADSEALSSILQRFQRPSSIAGECSTLEFETGTTGAGFGGRRYWDDRRRRHRAGATGTTGAGAIGSSGAPAGVPSALDPHALGVEQSNSSIVYGKRFILKILRLLDEGESADLEMGRFLSLAGYANAPRLEGSIRWVPRQGAPATLGILQAFVPNQGDAWGRTLERLAQLIAAHPGPPGDGASEILAPHRDRARVLAHRTAELHLALGVPTGNPAFDPEPLTLPLQQKLAEDASTMLGTNLRLLRELKAKGGGHVSLPLWAGDIVSRLRAFGQTAVGGMVTRVHGDLHLGQILETDGDVILIDFEGEPARPLAERRMKRSPLVDVAGLLRSFHYAATTAARASGANRWESAWMSAWHRAVSDTLRETYFERMSGSALLPGYPSVREQALSFFLLVKCLFELGYELDNRPDWVAVPLAGLKQLAEEGF